MATSNLFFHSKTIIMVKIHQPPKPIKRRRSNTPLLLLLLAACLITFGFRHFLEYDSNGDAQLAPWRKAKLQEELQQLNQAEQYALKATRPGYFPCFSCVGKDSIFLHVNQVWKYGITRYNQQIRYANLLQGKNLRYEIQFTGSLEACLKEEKRKIYFYAILPENLSRPTPLIRPPGNKQDN
jgi:hypothetical protein